MSRPTMTTLPTILSLALATGCSQAPTPTAPEPVAARARQAAQGSNGTTAQTRPEPSSNVAKGQDEKPRKWRKIEERLFQLDDLKRVELQVKGKTLYAWVMDTDLKRQEGMMFVRDSDFREDEGMIFVFPREEVRRFWMRNTLVPLDIAYLDRNGRVLNTYTMKALDETTDYSSRGRSMYVVEMKAGAVKRWGIVPGDRFEIPENVVSLD